MKKLITTLAVAGVLMVPVAASAADETTGVVQKIDEKAQKITIKHGELKNLEMPAMTMVFRAQDPTMLRSVKPGDNVRITVDRVNGQMTLTGIRKGR